MTDSLLPNTLADQRVFVTGATGFLGSALVQRLAADGVTVRALARSPQKAAAFRNLDVEVVYGDVTDANVIRSAIEDCSVVFHVAAALGGSDAQQRIVNVGGTQNILDAARASGVRRFVHVSTISVYGFNYRGDVTESATPAPGADPYGNTKLEGETRVRATDLDYTIIRPGMIYGAGAVNWTGNLFRLARLNPTPFVGAGAGSAFPIHVSDVVDLLITAASHPAAAWQIFNATPDPSPTWRDFIGQYQRLAGHSRWLALPPLPFYALGGLAMLVAPRQNMLRDLPDQISFIQRQVTYKMDKARALLGWTPRVDLATGVAGCADWLHQQGLLT